MDGAAKSQAVEAALAQIERQYGKGSIMSLTDGVQVDEGIPTGSASLDLALGGLGLPRGRIVEIYGPESSGKTTLTLHAIAEAQKAGGYAAFIDAEHAFDPAYAKKLGVDVDGDHFKVAQPMSGEEALDICEILVRSNAFDIIVVDSVAALVPKAELEGEMGDAHVGLQARLMSQALRKLTAAISRAKTTVVFINQIREKIGVFFGSPETTTGGRALKFYASVRIDIRRIGQIKDGEETIGNRTKATVVKNKCAPPFRKAEFDILFNKGINYLGDVLDLAVEYKVVDKSGSWLTYKGDRLGQGRDRALELLAGNAELVKTLEAAVKVSAKTRASALETKTSVVPRAAVVPPGPATTASAASGPSTGANAAGPNPARPATPTSSAASSSANAGPAVGAMKKAPVPPGAPAAKS
ncbi:MAG: recombinase RecA [Planctomycetes bacterium]|nr:recombinase RecA [Planctomycetota bacterium]MCC7169837.1 recombinase RecA [Planctomycetota bacterium]